MKIIDKILTGIIFIVGPIAIVYAIFNPIEIVITITQ